MPMTVMTVRARSFIAFMIYVIRFLWQSYDLIVEVGVKKMERRVGVGEVGGRLGVRRSRQRLYIRLAALRRRGRTSLHVWVA